MATGGGGVGGVIGGGSGVTVSGAIGGGLRRNIQTRGFFSRMQGAIAYAVAPPKLVVDKKTIEKSWKLMDKVGLTDGITRIKVLVIVYLRLHTRREINV